MPPTPVVFIHLVYVSAATDHPDNDALASILRVSRRNNARDGVSGMLLYSGRTYMQVLEGAPEAVDAAYARIELDPRHRVSQVLLREEKQQRYFPEWTMGFKNADHLTLEEQAGVNPLAQENETDPQRAHRLLKSFRSIARLQLD